ncbi:VOC family protein [Cellulomonas composti]|uniref:Putative 3-demethylubiquinone-9 3-methyltransferase n=1 Tax=Cellulomonas composti TaxID=266130 RepID=A0A511J990_9CELL|nr:VOC family protein [Cellulomonas composti]GEL94561.1 putative 3-demethylubiquinone-9 3-methyltransferase [Cellulomonas composti]
MGIVHPHLWYADNALEAAEFYVSVFPNSRITNVIHAPADMPGVAKGAAFIVQYELDGQRVEAISAGPYFQLTEAFSFVVECADQAEVDHYWDALLAGGGQESQCGWLKDRFGLSWQVVPQRLMELTLSPDADPEGAARATQVMLTQHKIEIAPIEAAYRGE